MERKERLKKAINRLRMDGLVGTDKDVAAKIPCPQQNLSKALSGSERYLTDSFLRRFNRAFGDYFNIGWLTDGVGDWLNPNAGFVSDSVGDYGKVVETRPRLPWKAMAGGGLRAYYAGEFRNQCEERSIFELFPAYQFSVTVDTNDMSPYLNVGDIVACNEVSMDYIIWGGVYLIDTEGGAMIRRVYEADNKNKVKLVAENEKYTDMVFDKKKVSAIYKIVGAVRVGI